MVASAAKHGKLEKYVSDNFQGKNAISVVKIQMIKILVKFDKFLKEGMRERERPKK